MSIAYDFELSLFPKWYNDAACKGLSEEIFFGDGEMKSGKISLSNAQLKKAQTICDTCPVFRDCLTHALTRREMYGVWAGTSRRARFRLFSLIDKNLVSIEDIVEGYYDGYGKLFESLEGAINEN